MSEIFRGHVEECLKHLGLRLSRAIPRGSRGASGAKKPMADFSGVTIDTVTRWLHNSKHVPVGEQYIKLMCFLSINGYKVLELERMKLKAKNFAQLIGFRLVTSREATEMLGYSNTSTLFQMLRGDHGANEEKEEKMWDMWKARKDKLDHAIEEAAVRYRLNFSSGDTQPDVLTGTSSSTQQSHCPREGVVDVMQGLLKLLDSGVFQDLGDAEWAALRSSGSMILRLSSHLSTLSARLVKPS